MINKSRDEYAYNIIDTDGDINNDDLEKIKNVEGILMARVI